MCIIQLHCSAPKEENEEILGGRYFCRKVETILMAVIPDILIFMEKCFMVYKGRKEGHLEANNSYSILFMPIVEIFVLPAKFLLKKFP